MSIPGSVNPLFLGAAGQATGGGEYQIERSVRFNSPDSAYFSRTPSGQDTTWTFSCWAKRSKLGTAQYITGVFVQGTYAAYIQFYTDDKLHLSFYGPTSTSTTAVYRDTAAWYHIVVSVTSGSASYIYVNGVQAATWTASANTYLFRSGYQNNISGYGSFGGSYFDGYLADVHYVGGQALTPTSFGEFDTNGVWQPIDASGLTYGTNGFHLPFSDNSTAAALGTDTSSNGNDWTVNNISASTGGPTSVAAASGALPVYNTTDTYGTTKGTGTRTDSNSSSIVLAISMDGTNGGTTFTDDSATIRGSGSAKTITRFNATTSTASSKFYGSSGAFNGTNAYLSLADSPDWAFGTSDFTVETWAYVNPGSALFLGQGDGGSPAWIIYGNLYIGPGIWSYNFGPSTPTGRWFHWAMVRQGTSVWFYVDGIQYGPYTGPSSWSDSTDALTIGQARGQYTNGYFQDFRIYKGAAKYTSSFNPPSSTQNATVGAGCDSLVDSPTNGSQEDTGVGGEVVGNYATLNPLHASGGSGTLTNGNLDSSYSSGGWYSRVGTIYVSSGKYYWEHTITAGSTSRYVFTGIATPAYNGADFPGSGAGNSYAWYGNEGNLRPTAQAGWNVTYDNGDVIGVALDMDNGKLYFSKNGTFVNSSNPATQTNPQVTGLVGYAWAPAVSYYTGYGGTVNFGQRPFAYTAPSGFKALCTTNLPEPTIADGSTAMDVALYTGNGSTQAISGLNFSPDFVWIKSRSNAYGHANFDIIRGATKYLSSNQTLAEATETQTLTAFNSDGFALGSDAAVNGSGATYAAWTWDAGSSTVTNTQGSISSQVRANASAGFSVVKYTNVASTNSTIGHGLGVAPKLLIVRYINQVSGWFVYHADAGAGKYLDLQSTGSAVTLSSLWNNTAPTSTVFSVGTAWTGSFDTIAYCFAPVAGYSSAFTWSGTGSTDGPAIYLGFRPKLIIWKRTDSAANWAILDSSRSSYNVADDWLGPNSSSAEAADNAAYAMDFLSNGLKIRATHEATNQSGGTYIGFAFAESPFKNSRAR
jgi:hypothetical protein